MGYYLIYPLLYLLSLLPFRVLYVLSDGLHFFIFRLVQYRRSVVIENLTRAFPDKRPAEIKVIQRRFQRYFCDLLVETVKLLSISAKSLRRRVTFEGTTYLEECLREGQSVILTMGHQGNWEMIGAGFAQHPWHPLYIIYRPIKNRAMDRLMIGLRTRLGNRLYTMKGTLRGMLSNRHEVTATAFLIDQAPAPDHAYWTQFMHQDTPVFRGTERISKKLEYPVMYLSITRRGRQGYVAHFRTITQAPRAEAPDHISESLTRELENDVRRQPEIWLWTHRRWKHSR